MLVVFAVFVRSWLKERILLLFDQMTPGDGALILAMPVLFLVMLFFGTRTIFNTGVLLAGPVSSVIFYLAFCLMMLILYILMISDRVTLMSERRSRAMLSAARPAIELKNEYHERIQP